MTLVGSLMGALPLSISITGRKRRLFMSLVDPVFRGTIRSDLIYTDYGPLTIDPAHEPQRLLLYAFANVMRHYEKSSLGQYIKSTAVEGTTFVDVGANLGVYSLLARRLGMNTVAVEPEPDHSSFLLRNEATFGKVLPVAFSSAPGQLPLYYNKKNPGATSLFASPNAKRSEEEVTVTTFSCAAKAGELGDPSLINLVKIDVEGFEEQAIQGMFDFLRDGHRPDLWIEVLGDASDRNPGSYRRVRCLLADFGYRAREFNGSKEVIPLVETDLSSRKSFDLLFTC